MRFAGVVLALLSAAPAAAQETEAFALGGDVFRAGGTAVHEAEGADDVFLAGETVRLGAEIGGSAHLAGRRVEIAGAVGQDVYAAGQEVSLGAPVAGDATLAGYDLQVTGEVGESLRATAATVRVAAPVGGPALLAGESVTLDAPIAGDVALMAETLQFGEAAAIGGRLVLYGDEDRLAAVPARVVPLERIELRTPEDRGGPPIAVGPPSIAMAAGGFLASVAVLALLAWLAAVIAPVGVEVMRDRVSLRPFRTLGLGFVALSALVGAAVVIALTIIGLVVAPVVLLAAMLLGFAGWVVAVYMIGSALWEAMRRGEPDTLGERALAALLGAAVASVIFLVPFLGWLLMLCAVLVGMGALTSVALSRRTTA